MNDNEMINLAPLYIQVKLDIKNKIEEGKWGIGEKIPTEGELCSFYDVSRVTIRQAIDELVNDGYLEKKRPKGTYVLDYLANSVPAGLSTYVKSFTNEMKERGLNVSTLFADIKLTKADEHIAKLLGVKEGDEVILLRRIRGINGVKIGYFKTYMKPNMKISLNPKDYYESLYALLEEKGIIVAQVKEKLSALRSTEEIREMLEVTQDCPILRRIRYAYKSNGDFIECSECYYNGDEYSYYLDFSPTAFS
ncbi:GntR family transcriptional regulator [Bacillus cytotoxicus]|uniref:GntR family transcriptional regulator n=1 Tax=Bacillus cytotoxicus TaxID=580165 RepID=A0ACC6AAW6_9BACI|nr:GntR family transcriptional regulator [Bacillus cytotoxicus]